MNIFFYLLFFDVLGWAPIVMGPGEPMRACGYGRHPSEHSPAGRDEAAEAPTARHAGAATRGHGGRRRGVGLEREAGADGRGGRRGRHGRSLVETASGATWGTGRRAGRGAVSAPGHARECGDHGGE